MKQVVVIGASVAAVRAIEKLQDQMSIEATFVFLDDQIPAVNEYFPRYLTQNIKPNDIFYRKKDFFDRPGISALFNKKIDRINFKRNRVTLQSNSQNESSRGSSFSSKNIAGSEKNQLDYDVLILSDIAGPSFPEIKGKQKIGVIFAERFNDIKFIFDNIGSLETVAIRSDSFFGLKLAQALVMRNKDVLMIIPAGWSTVLNDESREWIQSFFAKEGIRLMIGDDVVEILGDTEMKAIRLMTGKVMASQMIVYTDMPPDLRIVQDTDLKIGKGIPVDKGFKTNIENVFALDGMIEPVPDSRVTLFDIEKNGDLLAASLMDQPIPDNTGSIFVRQFDGEGLVMDWIGQIDFDDNVNIIKFFDKENNIFRAACLRNGILIGAFLMNDRKNLDKFLRIVKEQDTLTENERMLFNPTMSE